jgi:hypothetical protein
MNRNKTEAWKRKRRTESQRRNKLKNKQKGNNFQLDEVKLKVKFN